MPEYLLTVREDHGLFIRLPDEVAEQLDATPHARVNLAPVDGGFLLSSTKAGSGGRAAPPRAHDEGGR
jgi:hypothetical protein